MKTIYLVNKRQPDGALALEVATSTEWLSAVSANKQLPPERRRYFIRDYIADGKELDCMVIETSAEDYRTWNREHMAAERNRLEGKKFQHLSLDAKLFDTDEAESFLDVFSVAGPEEELFSNRTLLRDLRVALTRWKPWANDLLDLYLQGKRRTCTATVAEKYGVSEQTARKYKRQLEIFIKNFVAGVSL